MAQPRIIPEIENPYTTGESFADMIDGIEISNLERNTIVNGLVVAVNDKNVLIDFGYKSEGSVNTSDFPERERKELEVGQNIEVYIEALEGFKGEAQISRSRAIQEKARGILQDALNNGTTLTGVINEKVKGGYVVDLVDLSMVAFLPGSQVDLKPIKDATHLMHKEMPFQVVKMDTKRGNVVVSRRAILEESRAEEREEALKNIEAGMVLQGTVKNLTDYGAFVDLGAVDGLLHVTDISWKRISHPSEALKVGQDVTVKVIKYEEENGKISLGMKQMEDSPWKSVAGKYVVGTDYDGVITSTTDYGAFVELQDGIEGLVHQSEMSWVHKNLHPSKIAASGDKVRVRILEMDVENARLSLGMKQCYDNPWESFAGGNKANDVVKGKVVSVADFGLFVGLEGGLEGLVHINDVARGEEGADAIKQYSEGQDVEVKILSIDADKERIALGIRQLNESTASQAEMGVSTGDVRTFTVSTVDDNFVEVELDGKVVAKIFRKDLSKERSEQRTNRFAVGDKLDAKVIGYDSKERKLKVSIRQLEIDEEKDAIAQFGSTSSGATIGGILGAALEEAGADNKSDKK